MERAANVPNSPSSFATFTKGKTFEAVDDLTIRVSTEKSNPFIPNDMSRIAIIDSAESMIAILDISFGINGLDFSVETLIVKSSTASKVLPLVKVAKLDGLLGTLAARSIEAITSSAENAAPL